LRFSISGQSVSGIWLAGRLRGAATWQDGVRSALASVLGIVHSHTVSGWPGPPIGLLGRLRGLVAAQYLPSPAVALEIRRGEELALEVQASTGHAIRTRVAIPALLSNRSAHRARRCVLFLAEHPQASNREFASGVGVAHASQISKLLSCLLGERLVARHSAAPASATRGG
jgi:hypothetical protein